MRCRRYCHTALQLRGCHTLINCYFDGAYTSVTSHPAYLHDYGQILRIFDLDLPAVVEAHFSLEESGKSILRMGTCEKGITHIPIPDSCLEETGSFYCYIFDRDSTSGRTVYKIKIPVLKRADMPTETTEPSEQDVAYFEQVLAQIEQKAEEINSAVVSTAPYVVEFDTVGSGDSALCTCRQTYADVIDALASGRSVMAVEYRYGQSTDDDPYQTRYHCLIGAGTSQIKFGENGLTYINGRDPGYGDGWMITAPYIILKSNGTVVRTSATGSPAMMGDVNSLTSEVNNKADKLHVAVTKIEGDSASSPTADKTYEQIMAAVQEGAEIICTYTVQLVYGGEIEQEITQHLQFVRADEYNIHFGFCGWGLQMGKYRLSAHAIDISAYNDITVYDSSVEIATAANITTLTSRISQLEARVAALEGGNG